MAKCIVRGGIKRLYFKKKKRVPVDPGKTEYIQLLEGKKATRACYKCHRISVMHGDVCLDCLNRLREHHEQFEDIWDIPTPDLEKLTNPDNFDDIVWLMLQPRGGRAVEAWLGVESQSVWNYWNSFLEKAAAGCEEMAVIKRIKARLLRGERSKYAFLIPKEEKRVRSTKPEEIKRTQRRHAKKAAELAATQAVKEAC